MSDTIGQAIRRARKAKGLTLAKLGEIVNKDTGNLSRMETGKQGTTQKDLEKICLALGISLSGAIAANTMHTHNENTSIPKNTVPVIQYAQIAQWIHRMEEFRKIDAESWIPCPVKHGIRTFCVKVTGDSMMAIGSNRSFINGDYIYCDHDRPPKHGDPVMARLTGASPPVFRQLLIDGDQQFLQALNPAWPDSIVELPPGGVVIGAVIFRGQAF
jgi:SOS-response transcriptional repressor LexA